MKYFELDFTMTPCSQDARDVLSALAGEAGCESFEETEEGLRAYIQQQLYDRQALEQVLEGFPFADTRIEYKVREAEDRDWNEQWEQEGFEPILVGDRLVIHDGRHLPETVSGRACSIEIDAHLAFGTGTHETTRMICSMLTVMELKGKGVLDCGCGTGILGICALKLGAARCFAYDIDEWSADNTRHNAVINRVDEWLAVACGDAAVLDGTDELFDVVMANINRNILLQDMPRFVQRMAKGAALIISGFYESDCALLKDKAQSLGLQYCTTTKDGEWACMRLQKG